MGYVVTAPDRRPAMEALDDPVVDREPPVVEEAHERDPVIEQVLNRLSEQR
jgi:hypothetical protein